MLLVTAVLSTALQVATMGIASRTNLGLVSVPSGPYAVLFAVLYQFMHVIPSTYRVSLLGLSLSDKSFVNLLCAQLLYLQAPTSLVAAWSGLVAGALYRVNLFGIKKWRVPGVLSRLASQWVAPLLTGDPQRSASQLSATVPEQMEGFQSSAYARQRADGTITAQTREAADAMRDALGNLPTTPTLTEDQIDMLQAMFPAAQREQLVQAMLTNGNDMDRAVVSLLQE
jgi:hypothetical protein